MPTAVADPSKGLARVRERIRVYQAWARGKNGTPLARWSLGEMGGIANELTGKLPRRRLNDPEQAELLLGYLAKSEGKGKGNTEGENQ
jgi:hypothetical protein